MGDLFSFGFSAGLCGEVFFLPVLFSRVLSCLPLHRLALKPNGIFSGFNK